ncbi:hypothetical protein OPKNFCMD_3957 [Methylobacterium crusticola]|uniref:Uncharacterized protein n=1 Tax=Methylobacterium crusticola TaxID=1697972 RepID=A0ABQ4R2M0_9HYPH|nr:hypothetical protein [Methylobacterium crusticola]GJD51205.1 hypothetical protein OPKNFCMD_3957 [Methylobacterium crusticola]
MHVDRVLQARRAGALIVARGWSLSIPDLGPLEAVAEYTPDSLHGEAKQRDRRSRSAGAVRPPG